MLLNLAAQEYTAVVEPSSKVRVFSPSARRGVAAVAAGATGVLFVCGAAAWFSNAATQHLRTSKDSVDVEGLMEAWTSERCGTATASSKCGQWEADMEYQVDGGWYTAMDHVPSAEMCCAMCQGVEQCQSFTWVPDAGLDGCPSQCWLKGGLPGNKVSKPGFVSGISPERPQFMPVEAKVSPDPNNGMFCWSLIVPDSYEEALIKFQQEEEIAIFACDSWAVYSNISKALTPTLQTTQVKVDLTVSFGGDSYTALNSWIFIAVWKRVIDEKRHMTFPWIVKVDPDAVFFAERLRPIVAQHAGVGYINNCKFGLHGPIEVLSASALTTLEADYAASWDGKAPKQCVEGLHFSEWGEDFFLSQCMWKIHGITRELDNTLMCEAHCDCHDWYWCDRADMVTFHPFKRPDMYKQCMANSRAAGRVG